jgi:restriction system protein
MKRPTKEPALGKSKQMSLLQMKSNTKSWKEAATNEFLRMLEEAGKTGVIDLRGFAGPDAPKLSLDEWDAAVREAIAITYQASLSVSSILIPDKKAAEGLLLKSTSVIWTEIVRRLNKSWDTAYQIPPEKWEEIIAGAFHKAGYDEVILTPRSGDYGRDVIAVKHGVGCIKIIGSVKAYRADRLVRHDDVRALLGVLSGEQNASKAIITTTADFAPGIKSDPIIRPFLPTRLELMNGKELRKWLSGLLKK